MDPNWELEEFKKNAASVVGLSLRSKAATIRRLAPDIAKYVELGYSLPQLLNVLLQAGLSPTPLSTLKSVLARQRAHQTRQSASDGSPNTHPGGTT